MTIQTTKIFISIALVHAILWVLLPVLLLGNLPLDVIELFAWGHEWQLGYDKHPPLTPWLAEAGYILFGGSKVTSFALSQICIVLTFYCVWKLAKEYLDAPLALCAVLMLEGIVYYNYTTVEFNPNVLQLPLWAAFTLAFYRALVEGRNQHLLYCAIFAGLAARLALERA